MRSLIPHRWTPFAGPLVVALLLGWSSACNVGVTAQGRGEGDSTSDDADTDTGPEPSDDGDDLQADAESILVRFLNLSDVDVDTEFFATNEPLADPRNELFESAHRVQVGIGAFGSGVVLVGHTDEILFPCTDTTFLGTDGGKYRDPDLGTLLGEGRPRLAEVGLNFDCGNTIIFTYRGEDGDYSTEPPIVDFTD